MTCDIRMGRVLGLPVVHGERLVGHVERCVLDAAGKSLRGLVIRRGLGGAKWVGREGVGVLGDVSVILTQAPARPPRDADFSLRLVKDEGGLTLGRVTDVWLSPESLSVTALEITLGLAEELRSGRLRVCDWVVLPGEDGDAQVLIPRSEWDGGRTDAVRLKEKDDGG